MPLRWMFDLDEAIVAPPVQQVCEEVAETMRAAGRLAHPAEAFVSRAGVQVWQERMHQVNLIGRYNACLESDAELAWFGAASRPAKLCRRCGMVVEWHMRRPLKSFEDGEAQRQSFQRSLI